eukprot:2057824-Amphidinium_carterae.1
MVLYFSLSNSEFICSFLEIWDGQPLKRKSLAMKTSWWQSLSCCLYWLMMGSHASCDEMFAPGGASHGVGA